MVDILANMGCNGLQVESIKDAHELKDFLRLKNILWDEILRVMRHGNHNV